MGKHNALGEFLTACRARRQPCDLGIAGGTGTRRTPGLRREEVASAGGISVDYYTRLEQGRERNPSTSVMEALARVLALDDGERRHLLNLTRNAEGRSRTTTRAATRPVRPTVLETLESVAPCPAYVLNSVNDVLAMNASGRALLVGIDQWPRHRRNSLRYLFRHPAARSLFAHWTDVAADSVAHLRASFGDDPCDPALRALVDELTESSEEFGDMWRRNEVHPKTAGAKVFEHPAVGRMELDFELLAVRGTDQNIVLYPAAPGSSKYEAMTLLDLVAREREPEKSAVDS